MDGDDKNNCSNNLKWGSSQENSDDMMKHGTTSRGSTRPGAKLSEMETRAMNWNQIKNGIAEAIA